MYWYQTKCGDFFNKVLHITILLSQLRLAFIGKFKNNSQIVIRQPFLLVSIEN
jgi:hypothetical protein